MKILFGILFKATPSTNTLWLTEIKLRLFLGGNLWLRLWSNAKWIQMDLHWHFQLRCRLVNISFVNLLKLVFTCCYCNFFDFWKLLNKWFVQHNFCWTKWNCLHDGVQCEYQHRFPREIYVGKLNVPCVNFCNWVYNDANGKNLIYNYWTSGCREKKVYSFCFFRVRRLNTRIKI